ncbi:two-component sensor histidine kinase [Rhizocola hellebori]|uniref:histidine kinase n=1 Tax=Rhizocola hellebori TaxID=1392758 RepID=A0A8J3QAH8_9ACTN|nr:histidine kinase [Rhizocola hellebori]GIH06409.1 two-component sensor histidine kinase [Rhizocola hellebori]
MDTSQTRRRRPFWLAYRPPGWTVERIIGTVVMVAAPLTTRAEPAASVWALMTAGVAGWIAFLAFERRLPTVALIALGISAVATAQTIAATDDGTGVIMACVALTGLATYTRPSLGMIMMVTGLVLGSVALGQLVRGQPLTDLTADATVILIVVVLALVRRDYRVKAEHAHRLLEREEHARREHARAAALDERARIARELHDVLAHALGSLAIQLEVVDALLTERGDADAALPRVRLARRLAAEGLTEARLAVAALRDDAPPLPKALLQLVDAHASSGANPATLTIDGNPRPIAADAAVSLIRTAREALTNAAKHAPGAAVAMVVAYLADTVRLSVRNARGARTTEASSPRGYGLTGMAERVALAGGSFAAGEDADGWHVTAEVPA